MIERPLVQCQRAKFPPFLQGRGTEITIPSRLHKQTGSIVISYTITFYALQYPPSKTARRLYCTYLKQRYQCQCSLSTRLHRCSFQPCCRASCRSSTPWHREPSHYWAWSAWTALHRSARGSLRQCCPRSGRCILHNHSNRQRASPYLGHASLTAKEALSRPRRSLPGGWVPQLSAARTLGPWCEHKEDQCKQTPETIAFGNRKPKLHL